MSVEVMRSVIDAAEGRVPVDTLFTNAQIVDVYGQRVAPGSVAVKDGGRRLPGPLSCPRFY